LRRPLKFACRFASTVITVASSEGNLKEAAVIETSRIAKVRSVSASLWIAPVQSLQLDAGVGGFELPVGLGVMLVAAVLPCVDFAGEDLLVGDAAIQKLPSFSMTGATRA
jgi:hypothetical protein